MIKILITLLSIQNAYSSKICDPYKNIEDKNISPSTDKTCKSHQLYYGFKVKADHEAAVKCAYRELVEKPDAQIPAAILMMSYANGKGVKQDSQLALKYGCLFDPELSEIEGRLTSGNFDVCNFEDRKSLEGHCAYIDYTKDSEIRKARIEKITTTFGVDSQKAFKKLEASFLAFKKLFLAVAVRTTSRRTDFCLIRRA